MIAVALLSRARDHEFLRQFRELRLGLPVGVPLHFTSFMDMEKSANYAFCNEVYGSLLYSPERSKEHISEIIDVMKILSENVLDEKGYSSMSELRYALKQ